MAGYALAIVLIALILASVTGVCTPEECSKSIISTFADGIAQKVLLDTYIIAALSIVYVVSLVWSSFDAGW